MPEELIEKPGPGAASRRGRSGHLAWATAPSRPAEGSGAPWGSKQPASGLGSLPWQSPENTDAKALLLNVSKPSPSCPKCFSAWQEPFKAPKFFLPQVYFCIVTKSSLHLFSFPTRCFLRPLNHLGEGISQCLSFKHSVLKYGLGVVVVLHSCLRFFPVWIFEPEGCVECDPSVFFSHRFTGCAVPGVLLVRLSFSLDGEHCL